MDSYRLAPKPTRSELAAWRNRRRLDAAPSSTPEPARAAAPASSPGTCARRRSRQRPRAVRASPSPVEGERGVVLAAEAVVRADRESVGRRTITLDLAMGKLSLALLRRAASPVEGDGARGPMTWGVSADEESFHGHYGSKEEALSAAPSELELKPGQRFWVGGGRMWRPAYSVEVDALFDHLAEHAGDECGEIAEDWLANVPRADADALEADLHAAVMRWLGRTGNLPTFYCCEVVEAFTYQTTQPAPPEPESGGAATSEATEALLRIYERALAEIATARCRPGKLKDMALDALKVGQAARLEER